MSNTVINREAKNTETKLFGDFTIDQFNIMIKNNDLQLLLNKICSINNDEISIDYRYFKPFASIATYDLIINYIISTIDSVLSTYNTFTVRVCMKTLSVIDAEKHNKFIYNISKLFKERYTDKLNQCFIYNAPFIFARVYDIIRPFIDKPTQNKIIMVK